MPTKKKANNRWTLQTPVKKGLTTVTLAEYLNKATKPKKPKIKSDLDYHLQKRGQTMFCNNCEQRGLPRPTPEYKPFLDIGRYHAVDFYFEHNGIRLALEIEGWGHRTYTRYEQDIWKYNELAVRKIHLLRVKPKKVYQEETFDVIKRFFGL